MAALPRMLTAMPPVSVSSAILRLLPPRLRTLDFVLTDVEFSDEVSLPSTLETLACDLVEGCTALLARSKGRQLNTLKLSDCRYYTELILPSTISLLVLNYRSFQPLDTLPLTTPSFPEMKQLRSLTIVDPNHFRSMSTVVLWLSEIPQRIDTLILTRVQIPFDRLRPSTFSY